MACKLEKDKKELFDALGKKGDTPTVFIRSADSLIVTVTAAHQNGVPVPVLPGNRMLLHPLEANTLLNVTLMGVAAENVIHLMEDCDSSPAAELVAKFVGGKPGQTNPNTGFTIHAK